MGRLHPHLRIGLILAAALGASATAAQAQVIISEIYGGGGSSSASSAYKTDFIELYNAGNAPVDLRGYSLQYGSSAGSSISATNTGVINDTTTATGTAGNGITIIQPHGFFLVRTGNPSGTVPATVPDLTGYDATLGLNLSGTAGKVFLVQGRTAVTLGATAPRSVTPAAGQTVLDYVGFGATADTYEGTGSATYTADVALSIQRIRPPAGGRQDTNNNTADFAASATPTPQNSASPADPPVAPPAPMIVINEVYGAGGGGSSTTPDPANSPAYKNDYVELYNNGTTAVNLNGYSLQYAASGGTNSPTATTILTIDAASTGGANGRGSTTIAAGGYFLIKLGGSVSGTTPGADLTGQDATGTITLSETNGKVFLATDATPVTYVAGSNGYAPRTAGFSANVLDLVGYGTAAAYEGTAAAPALNRFTSIQRKGTGQDTNDNAADFAAPTTPSPRSSAGPATPAAPVAGAPSATTLTFSSQANNTTSAGQTVTVSVANALGNVFATISGANAGDFAVTPASMASPATFTVTFTPTAAGARTATLTLASTGTAPQTVTLTGTGAGVIPVELTSFTARSVGGAVELAWTTASETNNAGFSVQRASGASWVELAFVSGHNTTVEAQRYGYTDRTATGAVRYRLVQRDLDGTITVGPTVEASTVAPQKFALLPASPNPFNPTTTISFTLPVSARVTLAVYDALGRQVKTLIDGVEMTAASHQQAFDASGLTTGVYLVRLTAGSQVMTQRVMLVK